VQEELAQLVRVALEEVGLRQVVPVHQAVVAVLEALAEMHQTLALAYQAMGALALTGNRSELSMLAAEEEAQALLALTRQRPEMAVLVAVQTVELLLVAALMASAAK
jgi:hypothetical protein